MNLVKFLTLRVFALAAISSTLFISPQSFAATYEIDAAHSTVSFKIKHLGISTVNGNFGEFEGSIDFEPSKLSEGKVSAAISTSSVNTSNKKRDDHLRNEDFFDVTKHPLMIFTSKEIRNVKGDEFEIIGDLTMHGVTKEIVLETEYSGAVTDPWGNEKVGFSAQAKLNRKEYGLNWSKLLETGGLVVGEDVKVQIEIEATKKKA